MGGFYDFVAKYWDSMYAQESFYKDGFKSIDSWRKKYGLEKEILDVSCGTGHLLKFFEKAGYKTYGSDNSSAMLKIAKKSLKNTKLKKAAFQKVSFGKKFPLIISFFNSFAHCLSKSELKKTLKNLAAQTTDDGLIIFDLVVAKTPPERFGTQTYTFGKTHISRTFYGHLRKGRWYSDHVYVIIKNKKTKISVQKMIRGIFSEKDVVECINQAGLKPVRISYDYLAKVSKTFVVKKK